MTQRRKTEIIIIINIDYVPKYHQ